MKKTSEPNSDSKLPNSEFKLPKWQFPSPFTDDYWHAELAFYGKPKVKPKPPITLDWLTIQGRCDDYLSVNMRFDDTPFPRLLMDGRLWMSLTPMEVQSAAVSILLAKGKVVLGGLGLGYTALRIAAKKSVKEVVVYEIRTDLIEWFKAVFADRDGFAKIRFVEGDMRQTCKGDTADLAYVDIYDALCGDEVITDSKRLRKANKFQQYVFWGWERVWFDGLRLGLIKSSLFLPTYLLNYFRHWQRSDSLRPPHPFEKDYVRKAMTATELLFA